MDRRTASIGLMGAVVAVLFAAAATSGPVPLADGPPTFLDGIEVDRPAEPIVLGPARAEEVDAEPWEMPAGAETILRTIVTLLFVAGAVAALYRLWQHRGNLRLRWRRAGPATEVEVLDDVVSSLSADAGQQRAVLRRGTPRNAIVECWLRLEAAVTDAGVVRDPADTSAEFTERVLGACSVDPAALGELSMLYREARFSDHEMGESARQRAIEALDTVHRDLTGHPGERRREQLAT